jgi:phosphoribosyl 1,2-cyclic phosphate phosphodiesterase
MGGGASEVSGRVTFLGTGTSHGVPMIGCSCETCTSTDPRDTRWRPSIAIALRSGKTLLVDTSPDLRSQALRFGPARVDAILFTHPHADHLLGLDDIRRYNAIQRAAIPCYGNAHTVEEIRRIFAYAFQPLQHGGGIPQLALFHLAGACCLGGETVTPVPIMHGRLPIYGYRVGSFAYLTDCSAIPESSFLLLEGVRVLTIDALRHRPHPTHFTVEQALATIERVRPDRALLTHVCHDLRHEPTSARLPAGVELAYDGLVVEI